MGYLQTIPAQDMFIIAVASFTVLAVLVMLIARRSRQEPYNRITSIFTPAEQRFYKTLKAAVEGKAIIFAKVRIADLVRVKRAFGKRTFWRHFSRISQKHIDFVLVDPDTYETRCLIELDDSSHYRPQTMQRDRFVNETMAQCGIQLHRVKVQRRYDRQAIRDMMSL